MNENKTTSILQRLPLILAVTAASYGLTLPVAARNAPAGNAATANAQQAHSLPRR